MNQASHQECGNPVYIRRTAEFLPNASVANEEMESYLGRVSDQPSRVKKIVLRRNGIERRHYALDVKGEMTHSNAEMAALAVRGLFDSHPQELESVDLLCCGTSTADQTLPGHGVMVHGLLPELSMVEAMSPSGACCSGMYALKYAYLGLKSGEARRAVAAGSERASGLMTRGQFDSEVAELKSVAENSYLAFNKDFLRWMLSDGAGAFLLDTQKNEDRLSLRLDWIDGCSFAHELPTCMYAGAEKSESGGLVSYKDMDAAHGASRSIMSMKQDVELLREHIVAAGFRWWQEVLRRRSLDPGEVTYFLPHLSSYVFADALSEVFRARGHGIPEDRWFMNLRTKGNVGSASIYLAVDELMKSGELRPGDRLVLFVPESARFTYVVASLTVVEP